eukprot:6229296-Pyramimonas_sp.AAC.1
MSAALCIIEQNMSSLHNEFPIKLFQLLRDPTLADAMPKEPPCVMDSWTADMLTRHPGFVGP